MNIIETSSLNSVEGIEKAIADNKDNQMMLAVLETLLQTKKREIELIEKAAKKSGNSKFSDSELIAKNVYIAVRQQVIVGDAGCSAVLAFNGAIKALDMVLDKELQENFFKSSVLHCGKSNLNKAKSVYEAIQNYKEAVRQSKLLLPFITNDTWQAWEASMYEVAKNVIKKRGEVWKEPDNKGTETPADNKGTETPADNKGTETPADNKGTETPADNKGTETPAKTTVITTRKSGKRK